MWGSTWEMAVITQTGNYTVNVQGDVRPEEKTALFKGVTPAERRQKVLAGTGEPGSSDKPVIETKPGKKVW
ncbi:MAG: hypothetical protein LBB98_10335 [Treponema sp.]|jgi:hypothetical protein|nr:hypothetical protein [Treponema sp.]